MHVSCFLLLQIHYRTLLGYTVGSIWGTKVKCGAAHNDACILKITVVLILRFHVLEVQTLAFCLLASKRLGGVLQARAPPNRVEWKDRGSLGSKQALNVCSRTELLFLVRWTVHCSEHCSLAIVCKSVFWLWCLKVLAQHAVRDARWDLTQKDVHLCHLIWCGV